jgi:hypothetical protein
MTAACPASLSEAWDYLDADVLRPSRSSAVCITCQHFCYEVGKHCVTLLTCPIHQGLIPQGQHLTKRCSRWVPGREVRQGWFPKAG